jgi:hypothetical protein
MCGEENCSRTLLRQRSECKGVFVILDALLLKKHLIRCQQRERAAALAGTRCVAPGRSPATKLFDPCASQNTYLSCIFRLHESVRCGTGQDWDHSDPFDRRGRLELATPGLEGLSGRFPPFTLSCLTLLWINNLGQKSWCDLYSDLPVFCLQGPHKIPHSVRAQFADEKSGCLDRTSCPAMRPTEAGHLTEEIR